MSLHDQVLTARAALISAGRKPSHLVLGKSELREVEAFAKTHFKVGPIRYLGLEVLKCDLESLLVVAEDFRL